MKRKFKSALAIAAVATAGLLALGLAGKFGTSSTASAQNSTSVSCVPLSCFGNASYANQCREARKGWEENKRACEHGLDFDKAAMERCIHALDATVNRPCTCAADACPRVICTQWKASDNACMSAEWRH